MHESVSNSSRADMLRVASDPEWRPFPSWERVLALRLLRTSKLLHLAFSFSSFITLSPHPHSHTSSRSTITFHHHTPPSHSTITLHHHAPPSHSTITLYHHAPPSRSAILLHSFAHSLIRTALTYAVVGNLNGRNGIRTTAAQISTSFVRCIKGGLCRSGSKNTSRRRRPSRQTLRPCCRKLLMSFIHVLVCAPRAYIPSSSNSMALTLCINQTSNSSSLNTIKLVFSDLK